MLRLVSLNLDNSEGSPKIQNSLQSYKPASPFAQSCFSHFMITDVNPEITHR